MSLVNPILLVEKKSSKGAIQARVCMLASDATTIINEYLIKDHKKASALCRALKEKGILGVPYYAQSQTAVNSK